MKSLPQGDGDCPFETDCDPGDEQPFSHLEQCLADQLRLNQTLANAPHQPSEEEWSDIGRPFVNIPPNAPSYNDPRTWAKEMLPSKPRNSGGFDDTDSDGPSDMNISLHEKRRMLLARMLNRRP